MAALLARRCLITGQGEPGETGQRVLLDEVLAAVAAAVPSLQPQLLQPLRGLLQHQARIAYGASACAPAVVQLVCTLVLWPIALTVPFCIQRLSCSGLQDASTATRLDAERLGHEKPEWQFAISNRGMCAGSRSQR